MQFMPSRNFMHIFADSVNIRIIALIIFVIALNTKFSIHNQSINHSVKFYKQISFLCLTLAPVITTIVTTSVLLCVAGITGPGMPHSLPNKYHIKLQRVQNTVSGAARKRFFHSLESMRRDKRLMSK